MLLRLGDGVGEGALPPYYPYTFAEAAAYLESLDPDALLGDDPLALEDALDRLPPWRGGAGNAYPGRIAGPAFNGAIPPSTIVDRTSDPQPGQDPEQAPRVRNLLRLPTANL